MKSLYESLVKNENVRESLVQLKQRLKDQKEKTRFETISGKQYDFLMKLLIDEDPKVRKHVAGVLGELKCQEALDVLWDAYESENTRFVKADYVKAMARLDCKKYLREFRQKLQELTDYHPKEEEKKHVQTEIKEVQQLLLDQDKVIKHVFKGYYVPNEVILTTLPIFRTITANQIKNAPVTMVGAGVKTKTADLDSIMKIRTFKELLFVLHGVKPLEPDPKQIADGLMDSDMMDIIQKNHEGVGPYFFRLGFSGDISMEKKSILTKKTVQFLEDATDRVLVNSASHYELEIRLIQNKEGKLYPCLKFYTLKDNRFAYRKYHISTGMQPYIAAGLLKLAEEYIRDHAQILDPVCGAGTMLIERNYLKPARTSYGLDIFGEAIEKARANTKIANMHINYINRNFNDFSHEYLFDEILADMPQKGALSYDELSMLYQKLFDRACEWLNPSGILLIYSSEVGFVKKQIRIHEKFRLEKEFCISEKQKQYLYVIRYE